MTLAGTPPITTLSSKDLLTTAPDAITEFLPIFTPSKIVTFDPIQQLLPIFIPFLLTPCSLIDFLSSLKLWFSGWALKYWPIIVKHFIQYLLSDIFNKFIT